MQAVKEEEKGLYGRENPTGSIYEMKFDLRPLYILQKIFSFPRPM